MKRDLPKQEEGAPDPVAGGSGSGKRTGSRLVLAASLVAGITVAIFAGATIADFLSDNMGVTSTAVRIGLKVACIAALLPAGFYLVERYFLFRSSRGK